MPEWWLEPTTPDQCGQNPDLHTFHYIWESFLWFSCYPALIVSVWITRISQLTSTVPDELSLPKTMDFVCKTIASLSAPLTTRERKDVTQSSGCTGDYSLRLLPFCDWYLNTPVEPIHLIKNTSECMVKVLSGVNDTVKVHQDRKWFRSSWIRKGRGKMTKSDSVFHQHLTGFQKMRFC